MTNPYVRQVIKLILLDNKSDLENNNGDNIEELVQDAYQAVFEVKKNVGKCDFRGDWKSILLSRVCMIQR